MLVQWIRENAIICIDSAKVGTTLTQQLCHEIMKCYYLKTQSPNHAYYATTDAHYNVGEWIEMSRSTSKEQFEGFIEATKNTKRFWKTHALLQHFPSKSLPKKMVIVCRNPKDACVSFYHHTKNNKMFSFDSPFSTFFALWIAGVVGADCYFRFYADYWKLYKSKERETEVLWLNF